MTEPRHSFNVLIAGGGTAALEAALALRELAGDRVTTTLLTPDAEFVYRPARVREPFAGPAAQRYPLAEFAAHAGVELRSDSFDWLDAAQRVVHTAAGEQLGYDALLLAMGARLRPRFKHAVTLDDRKLDEQLHGLIQDIEAGYVHKLAFVAPNPMAWPLPLYELALLTAGRAYEMNEDASVTIVTSEDAPLAVFGAEASHAVQELLDAARILLVSSTQADVPERGQVALYPGGHTLYVDRIIALPELFGPSTPGVPKSDGHGFISVDEHCRVRGLDRVYAAGDATDFPVKHGGVAAQQADAAAAAIAELAGAPVEARPWSPDIHGLLLGGEKPLYLSAHITGTHGSRSVVSSEPDWSPGAKIAAPYLAPYLESRDRARADAHADSAHEDERTERV
jgi:sulfide:quinone oxidoreductase